MQRRTIAIAALCFLAVAAAGPAAHAQSTITKSVENGVTVYRGGVAPSATADYVPVKKATIKREPAVFTGSSGTEQRYLPGGRLTYTRYILVPVPTSKTSGSLPIPAAPPRSGVQRK